jgi:hypothetical protein
MSALMSANDPKQTSSSMAVAEESCGIDYSETIMTSVNRSADATAMMALTSCSRDWLP